MIATVYGVLPLRAGPALAEHRASDSHNQLNLLHAYQRVAVDGLKKTTDVR